ncbi:OLC1v1017772C1 [Oldenlandia corymbosa var. corymbosa]|uniref:OLC1v1017772C1 n=1 Tax=Oldenlandia corymbosa var. corymbosa TaxID=529605 RepID=A0AAV1EA54_OLDCO|nr:OLC1v1017772C1 [Oldenlandia corymbosa var. corymbosa]
MDDSHNFGVSPSIFQQFTCPDHREMYPQTLTLVSDVPDAPKAEAFPSVVKYYQKPRKKRTKLVRVEDFGVNSNKPKCAARKPNPDAAKITDPCSECGRRFPSQKALFGHMRCHPERQWRGINPPLNFRPNHNTNNNQASSSGTKKKFFSHIGSEDDDREVATSLLILANGPSASESPTVAGSQGTLETNNVNVVAGSDVADADVVAGPSSRKEAAYVLDLNLPAPAEDDASSSYPSEAALELRLGR